MSGAERNTSRGSRRCNEGPARAVSRQKYPAIKRSYALIYRSDEAQRVKQRERPPFQSHPLCKHRCWISRGRPFPTFLSLGPSDLRVDLYYPALPKPRTDQMLMIEVLVSSGTATNRKKCLVAALVQKFGEAGIDPSDIMVDMAACWIACCSNCGTSSRIVL
jgi:hypothetical protein